MCEVTHFSMWSILKSPLILGNDVTNMVGGVVFVQCVELLTSLSSQTNETLTIITNKALIDVNQVRLRVNIAGDGIPHRSCTGLCWLSREPHVEAFRQRGRRLITLGREPCEQVGISLLACVFARLTHVFSTFVFALLNTSPAEQTVDVDFSDVFFDQVRISCLVMPRFR